VLAAQKMRNAERECSERNLCKWPEIVSISTKNSVFWCDSAGGCTPVQQGSSAPARPFARPGSSPSPAPSSSSSPFFLFLFLSSSSSSSFYKKKSRRQGVAPHGIFSLELASGRWASRPSPPCGVWAILSTVSVDGVMSCRPPCRGRRGLHWRAA